MSFDELMTVNGKPPGHLLLMTESIRVKEDDSMHMSVTAVQITTAFVCAASGIRTSLMKLSIFASASASSSTVRNAPLPSTTPASLPSTLPSPGSSSVEALNPNEATKLMSSDGFGTSRARVRGEPHAHWVGARIARDGQEDSAPYHSGNAAHHVATIVKGEALIPEKHTYMRGRHESVAQGAQTAPSTHTRKRERPRTANVSCDAA
eukprot:4339465-Prymnesium_polylepis.1